MRALLVFLCVCASVVADEGMWLLNRVPVDTIEMKHGAQLDADWIEHVQKSCLRVSAGGSASFVSPQGLVMTNHHVGASSIYNLSTSERDLFEEGFCAKSLEEELPCPNLYVDQLIAIEDVTDHLKVAKNEAERKERIAQIVKEAKERTGLQPEMVTLFRGGEYHLYLYKRYSDVRLVMCPEASIAAFGGDIENFEFPRHALDMCFFRVYEEGVPLQCEHYLSWSERGAKGEEPLFVLGHPGRTERILTANHLEFLRDQDIPLVLQMIVGKIKLLQEFSEESEEYARIAGNLLHRYQNGYKVYRAFDEGLNNLSIIAKKAEGESGSEVYGEIAQLLKEVHPINTEYFVLERIGSAHFSKFFSWARTLVRAAEERRKPNDERLKEYQESELSTLLIELYSTEPVYPELEEVLLADSLERVKRALNKDHPLYQEIESLDSRELIQGSELLDMDYRKYLYENPDAVEESSDPMILLAKAFDPYARSVREKYENDFYGPQKECYAKLSQGGEGYPDATFTLRLSVGVMKGYQEGEEFISPMTTISTLYPKVGEPPFDLPKNWVEMEKRLEGTTPFNFVTTHDIIGGNSGSPMVNAQGEVVGLIFDGNRHSFMWNFDFDESVGRAISVHSAVIIESLQNVYGADRLVKEILGKE